MIDVIIPVYKPTEHILSILLMLSKQTIKPNKVIIVNTEQKYWDQFFRGFDLLAKYPFLEVHHISREDFDHGRTRNYGVSLSSADYFLLMTDDAVPKDEFLVEKLYDAFKNEQVGMSYARQLPAKRCNTIEKYTRSFNYPSESRLKGIQDLPVMGIKTFFASDVCCMYKRSIFDYMGGFIQKTIFNEDMIYARRMIENNYLISYSAEAKVYHSHNYTGLEYLKRNFDLGVSQADHPEIFGDVKSEGEGIKLVKSTSVYLAKHLMYPLIIKLIYHSGCKYIGFYLGKRYQKLPKWIIERITMSPSYFTN